MKIKNAFLFTAAITAVIGFTSFAPAFSFKEKIIFGNDTTTTRRVVIDYKYSLAIPKSMTVSTELNSEASLQYENPIAELYVIVIDEPVKDFAAVYKDLNDWDTTMTASENYRRVQMNLLGEGMKINGKPAIHKTKADDHAVEVVDFNGDVPGIDFPIAYKMGFLECDGNVYMIMTWTLADKKATHNASMEKMITSFRSEK